MYLDRVSAGVPWLLDPANPAVTEGLRAADRRAAGDACDAAALAADLPDLLVLLNERHFGLANGQASAERLEAWAAAWSDRLAAEHPRTWGAALGGDLYQLRWLVGDNHLRAPGEDAELLRAVDARGDEPVHGREPGPHIEVRELAGVLCVRIRQCGAPTAAGERLMAEFEAAHEQHFAYDRIIVDVRSNPGGSDGFVRHWMGDHTPHDVASVTDHIWRYDDSRLSYWNYAVYLEAVNGAVAPGLAEGRPAPHPGGELWVDFGTETFAAGSAPWGGRMLVLTDRRTASAGESVAWILREVFGAKLVGGRSSGCLTFGDLAPYLLPRSGLLVWLATHWFGWKDVEMVGLPLDLELDPRTPLEQVAGGFDTLYAEACH